MERKGDELVVKFNSTILFDTDKTDLTAQSQKDDLADFAQVLKKYPQTDLIIEGHTDSTGGTEMNQKLFEARGHAVVAFLQSQGVDASRMKAVGYGETAPSLITRRRRPHPEPPRPGQHRGERGPEKQDAQAASAQPRR